MSSPSHHSEFQWRQLGTKRSLLAHIEEISHCLCRTDPCTTPRCTTIQRLQTASFHLRPFAPTVKVISPDGNKRAKLHLPVAVSSFIINTIHLSSNWIFNIEMACFTPPQRQLQSIILVTTVTAQVAVQRSVLE